MGKFLHSFQFLKVANLYIQYQQLGEKEQVPILKSLRRKHYEIIIGAKLGGSGGSAAPAVFWSRSLVFY